MIHSVRQPAPAPAQQYFPLTPLQPPAPAPASPTVFFSHTIPAPASSSSLPNAVIFLACFYSCCSLCFGAAYFLRHVGVVLLFSLSPSTSTSFVSVASLPTWAASSAPPPIRAIFFFPFWISFCSYPFHRFSLVSSNIYRRFSRRAFLASVGSVLFIVVLICSFPFLSAGVAGYGHYPLLSLIVPALWTFAPSSPRVLPSYRSWGSSRISSIGTNQISSSACAPPPLVPKRRPSPAASRHRGAPTSLLPAPLYWS